MHFRPWLVGLLAFSVYCLTLSRGAYPGQSATLAASAARLIPESLPNHPYWSLLACGIARLPGQDMPLWLNLFSALCGAAAVALFGLLVFRLIFAAARDRSLADERFLPPEDDDDEADALPDILVAPPVANAPNRQATFAALLGGWAAALSLAFSVPFWSASTCLHYQTWDMLLLLVIVRLALLYRTTYRPRMALVIAFLCGAGCVESALFVPLAAVLFILLPLHLIQRNSAWERPLLFAGLLAAAGAVLSLLVLVSVQASSPLAGPVGVRSLLLELLRTHYGTLRHSLPHTGWLWFVVLAFMPAIALLLTARAALSTTPSTVRIGLHLVLMAAVLLCLFNAPVSPWVIARSSGRLPLMAYLAAAMGAGYLAAFWHQLGFACDDDEHRVAAGRENLVLTTRLRRWVGTGLGASLLVVVCIFPLVNLREADGRQGAFADTIAREVVTRLGLHAWIASDGLLDSHLLLAARAQGHPLHLLPLAAGDNALHVGQLRAWINAEPAFGGSHVRLLQAAGLGIQPFLDEWLHDAPSAEGDLIVLGTPLIWKKAGWRPVPSGLGYSGTKDLATLRGSDLLGSNRAVWSRLETILAPAAGAPPALDGLRLALRQQAGRTANDLGVLLQDLGRNAEAAEAYGAARRFDPENLSALFNQSLMTQPAPQAGDQDALALALRAHLGQNPPPMATIIARYGDIRHPDALANEGHVWALRGQTAIAKTELDRSLALAPDSTDVQRQLATLCLTQGDTAGSEKACRALLAADPADNQAMIGLASVALNRGRTDDARQWLNKARAAGASADALALCEASLLIQTGQADEALAKLHAVTDQHPDNIEAWSLLADVLFRRNALTEIEQRVLPSMSMAVGKGDHALVHLVRAQLRSRRQPPDFAGARTSYLRALALRPDLAGARNDLLNLDLRAGNAALLELDASNVLRADPDNAFANYLLATLLLGRNDLAGAEEHLRRSLAAHKSTEALNDLGETLRRQKRLPEAEKSVREALAQNPAFHQVWDTLGCILLDAGRPDEAAQAIEKALSLCDTDVNLDVSLVRVRIAQARINDARRTLREIPSRFKTIPAGVKAEIAALERQLASAATAPRALPGNPP